MFIEIAV